MRKIISAVIIIGFIVAFIFAQSRPSNPTNSQKKNQRPTPQPTETPSETPPIEDTQAVNDDEVLKIETNLVTVPVRVLDREGRFIASLQKEDFKLFEDGKEQEIQYFSNVEEPFTVVLMIDMSYSTIFKTTEIQNAAIGFTAQLRPKDKVMVVSFDGEVHPLCEPTTDRKVSSSAIKQTQIGQGTSLYEAVDYVIKKLRNIPGRKAVILFTDGVDTTSQKAYFEGNLRDAEESDALIYPVQYDTYSDVQRASQGSILNPTGKPTKTTPNNLPFPLPNPKTIPRPRRTPRPYPDPNGNPYPDPNGNPQRYPDSNGSPQTYPTPQTSRIPMGTGTDEAEYAKADTYLSEIAVRTGGRLQPATDKASMALAFSRIADELRQQYSLGFYPNEGKEGQKRRLKVKVNREKSVVRSRESYIFGKKAAKNKFAD